MASPEKKARYDVSRQVKDAIERDDWAEVARILSEYSRRDSDSVMTQLVSRDQWDAVIQVIRCVGDEERTWNIEGVLVKNNILLSVAEGNWRGISEMPHGRFLHSTLEWILQQACTRAKETDIVQYVLPHCEYDQLVTHRLWFVAGRMLQRGVDNEQIRWVIQVACSRAREDVVMAYVVPSCPNSALEFLLAELVSQRMWHAASRVLMRGVSDSQHCWALKEACCWAEGWQVKTHILPVCTHGQCNSVMTDLVSEGQWRSVEKLFTCVGNASMTMIGNKVHMDNQCLQLILSKDWISTLALLAINTKGSEEVSQFCKGNTRDTESVFQIYQRHNGVLRPVEFDTDFTWVDGEQAFPPIVKDLDSVFAVQCNIVITDCHKETVVCIIPRCAGHQLDSVFTQCCDTFLKSRPSREFVCTSTHCPDTWAIHKLDVNSANAQATVITSSKSTADQLNSVLRQMLTLPAWWTLGKVLEQGLADNSVTQILKQTLLYEDDQMIVEHVLPHCTDSQTDLAVTELVSAGQWKSVTKLVQLVGDRKQTWTVGGTSVDTTLLLQVAGGRWGEVGDMLQRGVDDAQFRWAVDTVILNADDECAKHVLSICEYHYNEHINLIMTKCIAASRWKLVQKLLELDVKKVWTVDEVSVERGMLQLLADKKWQEIGVMLTRGVGDPQHTWLTHTASLHTEWVDFRTYILPHCADDQLDSVLTTLVERRLWGAVSEVLMRDVSESVKRWAVVEATQHAERYDDLYYLLPHCADDQLDSVLTTLMERRLWGAAGEVLKRGVSDSVKRWAVMEACQHYEDNEDYDDTYITDTILPHCADDQLDSALSTLVERCMWLSVEAVLTRGVSDSMKQRAVEKMSEHCAAIDDFLISNTVVSHCADDQLDSVLKNLVGRRMWTSAGVLLRRGVSDSVKRWAVMEACQHFEENTYYGHDINYITVTILPHCADDQLDSVIITLAERGRFRNAEEVLERGVSDSIKQRAVEEVCKYSESDNDYFIRGIVSHCADEQLDSVLTTLVERHMWNSAGVLLRRRVSDSVKRWAVMEACQHYKDNGDYGHDENYITFTILPHCADDQLDSVLTTLVEQGQWKTVGKVLSRFANTFFEQCVVEKTCEHCKDIGVYFTDDHNTLAKAFTPGVHTLFADDQLDLIQDTFKTNDVCTAVRYESGREVSDSQRRVNIKTAFAHADQENLIKYILPYFVYDSIQSALKKLASLCFWKAFSVLLHYCIIDTLCMWTLATNNIDSKEKVFWDVVRNPCDGVKLHIPSFWRLVNWSDLQCSLSERLNWDTPFSEVLCGVLLGAVKEIWLSGRWKEIPLESTDITDEASSIVKELHQLVIPVLMECNTSCVPYLLLKMQKTQHRLDERRSMFRPFLPIYFTKCLIQEYYKRKAWQEMTNAILVVLTTVPVASGVQSVALRVMLRHNRWDVISHACLSGVCEQDRRQLFQAAVKQRQWSAVKRWADHTLYDDQRLWAMGEARQEKRWDVYLKLADHGLSEWERVGVLFRVTMHADWKLVRHMLKTVADVTDMIDLLTNTPGTLSKLGAKKYEQRISDCTEFKNNLTKDTHKLKTMAKRGKWCALLHNIRHTHNTQHARRATGTNIQKTLRSPKTIAKQRNWRVILHNTRHKQFLQHARGALKAAVSSEAWHAVMQLVRLETDVTRRDSLFRDMVRLRQWAVCRELLEQGVSHELSLELISEFIEHCQWTLVAMTMKCTMHDERRKKIMHLAIMTREGSVVWECINKLQTCLSVDEREELFQLAFSREVWQAVKPLIEEKDVTGITHRDTALLEAIEQHQWDVVDHCQRHHADINMKDDDGHTPIHRAARKEDWEAVKELTVRGGDPNLLDREGLSVLHRAIKAKQWDAVNLLIQYHGDIHQAAQYNYSTSDSRTPLGMLIDARQRELIELTLMWCPDQWKSVSGKGETALHAVFLSSWLDLVYYLIARKVDPLAVTKGGLTALCYAVLCKDCPQRMVAECIKMGFSTHQSPITESANSDWGHIYIQPTSEQIRLFRSPLVLAVIRGLPAVTQMLYESGACSNKQLFEMNTYLSHSPNYVLTGGGSSQSLFNAIWKDAQRCEYGDPGYSFDTEAMKKSADYLHQVCSTPRSLVSTCRLVISRCLTLSKTRHRDIAQLPLSPMMKDYLMFSDLTDPRYSDLSYKGKE